MEDYTSENTFITSEELEAQLEALEKEKEEEALRPRRELEAEARKAGKDETAPVLTETAVSRQSLYGDLLEKEADLEEQLREAQGKAPSDYMSQLFGQDVLPAAQPEKAAEIEAQLAKVRADKEYRYAVEVDGLDEYNKLKDLRSRLAEETDEATKANLEKQIKITEDVLQKKGVVMGIEAEGIEVPVQTALPTSRPGVIEPAITKAVANIKRSIESIYMPSVEAEPLVMDEDTATNLIAEITPILASGAGSSLAVGKALIALGKTSPKWQYFSAILAPAAGEAAFTTTEETATLAEDVFGRGWVEADIEAKKMAIIAESLVFDVAGEGVVKSAELVSKVPVLGGFLKVIPTLIFGGEKQARAEAGDRILSLLSLAAKGDVSPEREVELLQELRAQMSRNFEAQTGVKFDDYVKALEADAEAIAKGVDPRVIERSGEAVKLIPEDKFVPLTADLIDEDILRRLASGIETGEFAPAFIGARQRQREAIEQEKERIGESALPTAEEPRTVEQIAEEAEQAGASSRLKIKTVLENEKGVLTKQEEKAVDDLEQAVDTLRTQVQVSPAVSGVNAPTIQAMDRAADDASNVFFGLYKGADNQRKQIYQAYTDEASKIEIPAEDYQKFLEGIGGQEEIGNVVQILVKRESLSGEVLRQLQEQSRRFDEAIQAEIDAATASIPKPKGSKRNNPSEWSEYENKVFAEEQRIMQYLQENPAELKRLKEEIGFQDIKLSNIEGLLQGINAELRSATGAERVALDKMSRQLESFISQRVPENTKLGKLRTGANQYYQNFQGLYKYIPSEAKVPLRYGDDIESAMKQIQDVELGAMQNAFADMLEAAASDPRVAGQNIKNIRSQLQGEELAKFDEAVTNFFTNKIYGEEISVYVDDLSGEVDPKKVAAKAQQAAQKIAESIRNRKYAYLDTLAPGTRERILASAEELRTAGKDLRTRDKAVEKLKKDLNVQRKAIEDRPAAVFSEGTVGGNFGVDSIQAAADMILSKDARQIFEDSWEVAGVVGKKGEDGLTLAQRDLKKVMAQGISSLLLTPTDEVKKQIGEVSFAMLGKIIRSPAFDSAFPAGDPTRIAVERLAAKAAAVEASQKAGKLTRESITDILKQSRDLVDGVIRYAKGPLSREGRQASMVARAFFKLVGGQEEVNKILMEVFTDPTVAAKLLKEQEDILRRGLEDNPLRAYTSALNNYFLQRIGLTSLDEFNEKQQAYVIEEQMQEIGATGEEQPSQ